MHLSYPSSTSSRRIRQKRIVGWWLFCQNMMALRLWHSFLNTLSTLQSTVQKSSVQLTISQFIYIHIYIYIIVSNRLPQSPPLNHHSPGVSPTSRPRISRPSDIGPSDPDQDHRISRPSDHRIRTAGSSDHRISRPSDHRTIGSADHRTIGSADPSDRISRPSDHRTIGSADHRTIGSADHGPMIRWSADHRIRRSDYPLVC